MSNANNKDSIINLLNRQCKATQDRQPRKADLVQGEGFDSLCKKESLKLWWGFYGKLCMEEVLRSG